MLVLLPPSPAAGQTCDDWDSWDFFQSTSAGQVAACLRSGADPDVDRCIESSADPLARDENGNTPLHHAILGIPLERDAVYIPGARRPERAPDLAVVVRPIQSGADPRISNDHGDTPLHFAARAGDQAIARFLLEAGADADARDRLGNSPLHEAAGAGDPAMVALLLDMGVVVEVHGTDGSTPFHMALRQWGSSLAVAETLLEAGADVNARNRLGRNSLHLAVAASAKLRFTRRHASRVRPPPPFFSALGSM